MGSILKNAGAVFAKLSLRAMGISDVQNPFARLVRPNVAFPILSPEFRGVHLAHTKLGEDWNRGQHQSSEPGYWNSEATIQVRNICTPPLQEYHRPRLNRTLPARVEIGEMSAARDKSSPQMAQGQVWRIDDAYLHIVEIGRRMIYYKMARQAGERTLATQMIGIDALAAYLKATEATLMS